MKKLLAIAALLLASTAAQAQYTFEYGGRTIRVDPDRGTVQIPGVYDNTGRRRPNARATTMPIVTGRRASHRRRRPRPTEDRSADRTRGAASGSGSPSSGTVRAGGHTGGSRAGSRSPRAGRDRSGRANDGDRRRNAPADPATTRRRLRQRTRPASSAGAGSRTEGRARACRRCGHTGACAASGCPASRELAARRLADGREGRQGSHRSNAAPISAAIPSTRRPARTANRF